MPHTTNIKNTSPIRKSTTLTASSPALFAQGSAQDERNAQLVEAARGTTSIPNARQKETLKRIAQSVQPVDPSYLKDYGPVPAGILVHSIILIEMFLIYFYYMNIRTQSDLI